MLRSVAISNELQRFPKRCSLLRQRLSSTALLWFFGLALYGFLWQLKAEDLFSISSPLQFHVRLEESAIKQLEVSPKTYVVGSFQTDTGPALRVGVRLKGNTSMRSITDKPSLTIKFDFLSETQQFYSHKKLFLSNGGQDGTFLKEYLSAGLFRDVGVPANRVTYARVSLNGRDMGLYLVVEAINKSFLKSWFGSSSGNLYEGTLQDIDQELEQDNGSDHTRQDLKQLCAALQCEDPKAKLREISARLDVSAFISYVAMDTSLGHWDGYPQNVNNYRIYHNPATGKMSFIPHGLDSTFVLNTELRAGKRGLLVKTLFQYPEVKAQYRTMCERIASEIWNVETLTNRIQAALEKMVDLAVDDRECTAWIAAARGMCRLVQERGAQLRHFITIPERQPLVIAVGEMQSLLVDWFPNLAGGNPEFSQDEKLLRIVAQDVNSVGSWRKRLYLPEGRYEFGGKVALAYQATAASPATCAVRLRLSRQHVPWAFLEDTDFRVHKGEVDVAFGGDDVELICEFRSDTGRTMLLERGSLFLKKLR